MGDITTDFITATKKIHADVRAVLAALHLIREDVKVICEQSVEQADAQRHNQETEDSAKKQTQRVVTGSKADADPTHKEHANGNSKVDRYFEEFEKNLWADLKKPKSYIELAALIFLILYTCETRRTNNLTKAALQTSKKQFTQSQSTLKEQFQNDQRPYVWPLAIDAVPPTVKQPVRAFVYMANFGKTPAIREKSGSRIFINQNGLPDLMLRIDNWFAQLNENDVSDRSETIVPPGIPPDPKKSEAFIVANSEPVLPTDEKAVEFLKTGFGSFAVVGSIIYQDTSGTHYWSDYCWLNSQKVL
jgi:hypothetical protein